MNLQVTPVFEKNYNSKAKIVVNQGGTRSSKTYSICQLFFLYAQTEHNITLEIMRKTMPALRGTVMKDFIEIITQANYWDQVEYNRTDHVFHFKESDSTVQFNSLDQPQKKRGAKRKYLYLNEANEFTKEDWIQLIMRTEGRIWMDYNPSDEFHWIYDDVLTRQDSELIKSTYLDNPFIPDDIVKEIERLKETDPNYWRVYGLGERGVSEAVIYPAWEIFKDRPDYDDIVYGLDFGFNNPSSLVKIGFKDQGAYWEELIYESGLTNEDLIKRLQALVDKKAEIYADAAEPQRIEEIRRKGFNIKPANKSVKDGIDCVKARKLHIHYESINLQKEIRSYKYKQDSNGRVLEEPVKFDDHALDAGRYGTYNYILNKNYKPRTKFTVHRRI
jgi:phage terminase large subunit